MEASVSTQPVPVTLAGFGDRRSLAAAALTADGRCALVAGGGPAAVTVASLSDPWPSLTTELVLVVHSREEAAAAAAALVGGVAGAVLDERIGRDLSDAVVLTALGWRVVSAPAAAALLDRDGRHTAVLSRGEVNVLAALAAGATVLEVALAQQTKPALVNQRLASALVSLAALPERRSESEPRPDPSGRPEGDGPRRYS